MEPAPLPKPSLKQRLETLIAEYGKLAIILYFGIFFLTWTGFAFAFQTGLQAEASGIGVSGWGAAGAAYLATQATKPIRFGATMVLTPLVARLFGRRRSKP